VLSLLDTRPWPPTAFGLDSTPTASAATLRRRRNPVSSGARHTHGISNPQPTTPRSGNGIKPRAERAKGERRPGNRSSRATAKSGSPAPSVYSVSGRRRALTDLVNGTLVPVRRRERLGSRDQHRPRPRKSEPGAERDNDKHDRRQPSDWQSFRLSIDILAKRCRCRSEDKSEHQPIQQSKERNSESRPNRRQIVKRPKHGDDPEQRTDGPGGDRAATHAQKANVRLPSFLGCKRAANCGGAGRTKARDPACTNSAEDRCREDRQQRGPPHKAGWGRPAE